MNNSDENIKKIISLMQQDDSQDAPAGAVKWSKNLFRTRAARSRPSVAQKILAVLKMDLSPDKAAFGERSASAAAARQMLFEADENSIDLRIAEGEKGFTVTGQILGPGFENASVKFGELGTTANELSEFKFENIAAGKYDLTIQTGEKQIVLGPIELGAK